MKTPGQVSRACVSFWRDDPRNEPKFVGNGFIVTDEWVLTAMHVVRASTSLRVHDDPDARNQPCSEIHGLGKDLALVKLTDRPMSATRLRIGTPETIEVGTKLIYSGFTLDVPVAGKADRANPPGVEFEIQATNKTEPQTNTCVVQGNLPAGHSGCGVRLGDTVVAVVIADAPDYGFGLIYPLSRIADDLRAWIPKAFLPLEMTLRDQFSACFKDQFFEQINVRSSGCKLPNGLETALHDETTVAGRGRACMDAILEIAAVFQDLDPSAPGFKSGRDIFRRNLCEAMELAVRIVVNPASRYQASSGSNGVIVLNALYDLTGVLVMMEKKAAEYWPDAVDENLSRLVPKNLLKAPRRELGSAEYQIVELREMLLAWLPADIGASLKGLSGRAFDMMLAKLIRSNKIMFGERFFGIDADQHVGNVLSVEAKKWLNSTIGILVICITNTVDQGKPLYLNVNKLNDVDEIEEAEMEVWANISTLLVSLQTKNWTQP